MSSPAPSSKRARDAGALAPDASAKRARLNPGAAAISSLAESVNNFGQSLLKTLAPSDSLPPDPIRLATAIKTVIRLESPFLLSSELGVLIDLFRRDISNADTYLALEEIEDVRRDWVRSRLDTVPFI